tara:strand:- start:8280 stop:8585 length:306 start_codon:yes stop_codon:yes gene_type:complete
VFGILLKIVGDIGRLTMTKLCARGKNAAKRKFKVYPSAYANAYASKICAGKIKDPSGKKRKDWKGSAKSMAKGKRVGKPQGKIAKGCGAVMENRRKRTKYT